MYLDSVLNYCSARTTINNYLVRWCLLLFHFSLEANVCAHLVPEILRIPEERVLNAGAQRKFQLSADSLSCSVARTLGSCVPQLPNPPFQITFFTPYCKVILLRLTAIIFSSLETNRNNTAKRAERCFGGNFETYWWPLWIGNTASRFNADHFCLTQHS